jgi:chromosome segregation ATPase
MASKEAIAQLATLPERVAVVETKIHNLDDKIDELKVDVKDMHDCLDNTRDLLADRLKEMAEASNTQHAELAGKIKELQTIKNTATMYGMAVLAFLAGAGWIGHVNIPGIFKFIGL